MQAEMQVLSATTRLLFVAVLTSDSLLQASGNDPLIPWLSNRVNDLICNIFIQVLDKDCFDAPHDANKCISFMHKQLCKSQQVCCCAVSSRGHLEAGHIFSPIVWVLNILVNSAVLFQVVMFCLCASHCFSSCSVLLCVHCMMQIAPTGCGSCAPEDKGPKLMS